MSDVGKTPTANDLALMEQGSTPQTLLSDKVHLTGAAYNLVGELIYERMDELGYFDEMKIAMGLMSGTIEEGSKDSSGTLIDISEESQKAKKAAEQKIKSNYDAAMSALQKYLPGVVCWGDSLTAGSGGAGTSYPKVLKKLIEDKIFSKFDPAYNIDPAWKYLSVVEQYPLSTNILNMGIGGENTNTILGRNGAVPYVLSEDITIPEDRTAIEIKFKSENGANVYPLRQGNAGLETVTISGVEGVITYEAATQEYLFTRSSEGEETAVEAGTEIITSGSKVGKDYVTVIFMGQNDTKLVPEELIAKQKAILNSQGRNKDRYIIIGLHTGTKDSRAELETAMKSAFGSHYINLREYMATEGLKDADIEATSEDLALMAEGATPKSLLNDKIHFNAKGYELLGNLVYEKMDELGYFKEIKSPMGLK
jgi:lysophospholipase L1-like esterase